MKEIAYEICEFLNWVRIENVIYALSIVFQLTAGLLLVFGDVKISREADRKMVISNFCCQHGRPIVVDKNGMLKYYKGFRKSAKNTWLNKIAFLYLLIGYTVSIFGTSPYRYKWQFLIIIVIASLFLVKISNKFTERMAEKYCDVNEAEFDPETSIEMLL